MKHSFILLLLLFIFFQNKTVKAQEFGAFPSVKTGAEQTEKYISKLKDKRLHLLLMRPLI